MKSMASVLSLITVLFFSLSLMANAAEMSHSKMDHSSMNHDSMKVATSTPQLMEAGNDAFGTIQEAIAFLSNDPNTDWSTVNLEALRQHLLDMEDMTKNVDVISQMPIKNGMVAVVVPTTKRSAIALKRVFMAHPKVLKSESGFDMQVKFNNDQYTLTITTSNSADVDKIRGLGYIGLMAYGNHHQPHHLSIAKGSNPHDSH